MSEEDLKKENDPNEERLKIREIRSLRNKNRILSLIRLAGISICFYIDLLVILPLISNLETKYPLTSIVALIFSTKMSRRVFGIKIEEDKQDNYQEIVRLENELIEKELERAK